MFTSQAASRTESHIALKKFQLVWDQWKGTGRQLRQVEELLSDKEDKNTEQYDDNNTRDPEGKRDETI